MMQNLIQLGLSISVLTNLISIWFIIKVIRCQDQHIKSLADLVLAVAEQHMKSSYPNVIPINLKKP